MFESTRSRIYAAVAGLTAAVAGCNNGADNVPTAQLPLADRAQMTLHHQVDAADVLDLGLYFVQTNFSPEQVSAAFELLHSSQAVVLALEYARAGAQTEGLALQVAETGVLLETRQR